MSRIPNSFGLYFSLLDKPQRSFATSKGFLMMGLPLETLQKPTEWFSRTEKLIEILKAEVAWLSPGLWTIPGHLIQSYPSINPNTLIQLLGKNPQIDFPYLYASRSPFSTLPGSFTPDQYSGYLTPAWALWANSHLAQKIKNYPGNKTVIKSGGARFLLSEQVPFEMNDSLYSEWQKNWQALSELHITCSDVEEDISHYFLKRFDAKKFSELESGWVKERKILQEKKALESKILNDFRLLTEAHDPNMLVQAEKILDQVPIGHLLWDLIPALSELIKNDSINATDITKWLKLTEQHSSEAGAQTVETAATIAAKLNLRDHAIGLLKSFDWKTDLTRVSRMKKNRDFKLLAKDSEFNAILDKYAPAKK